MIRVHVTPLSLKHRLYLSRLPKQFGDISEFSSITTNTSEKSALHEFSQLEVCLARPGLLSVASTVSQSSSPLTNEQSSPPSELYYVSWAGRMSLFGLQTSQTQPSGSFGSANPSQGGLFGSQAQQPGGSSLFGSATQQNQPAGGIGQQQQPQAQQTGSLFSGLGSSAIQQPQQQGSLFQSLGSNARPQRPQQMGSTLMGQQLPQSQVPPPLTQSQSATPTIWTPGQGMTGGKS
jgi:nuclear pore complex protein Nup54